jgi:FkbM family methyltransferase
MYSQNNEEEIILKYFSSNSYEKGTVLSIGENDGKTLSNSLALIERGWSGILVEPDPGVFAKCVALHGDNRNVQCVNAAVGPVKGKQKFWSSGSLLGTGDMSLVSTLDPEELKRWEAARIPFREMEVDVITTEDLIDMLPAHQCFDFISIDAEGYDFLILTQIDLDRVGCNLICVEWNGKNFEQYDDYITGFGFRLIHSNQENLIYGR